MPTRREFLVSLGIGAAEMAAASANLGWEPNSLDTLLHEGDILTIEGIYEVDPVTHRSTSTLQRFVVTATDESVEMRPA